MNNTYERKLNVRINIKLFLAILGSIILLTLSLRGSTGGVLYYSAFVLLIPAVLLDNYTFDILLFFLIPLNNVIYIGSISIVTIIALLRVARNVIATGFKPRGGLTILWLLLFIAYSALLGYSTALIDSIKHLIMVILCISIFIDAAEDDDENYISRIVTAMSFGILASAGLSLIINGVSSGRFSITSESGINQLGLLCAICATYLVMEIIVSKENRILKLILTALLLVIGMLTVSRTFLMMIAIAALWIIIAVILKSKNILRNIFVLLIVLVGLILAFKYVPFLSEILNNMNARLNLLDSDSAGGRYLLWQQYLNVIFSSTKTALIGIGNYSNYGMKQVAHNMWIEILADTGLISLPIIFATFTSASRSIIAKVSNIKLTISVFLSININLSFHSFLFKCITNT